MMTFTPTTLQTLIYSLTYVALAWWVARRYVLPAAEIAREHDRRLDQDQRDEHAAMRRKVKDARHVLQQHEEQVVELETLLRTWHASVKEEYLQQRQKDEAYRVQRKRHKQREKERAVLQEGAHEGFAHAMKRVRHDANEWYAHADHDRLYRERMIAAARQQERTRVIHE